MPTKRNKLKCADCGKPLDHIGEICLQCSVELCDECFSDSGLCSECRDELEDEERNDGQT
jgi:predicted amidophosphoribosyltransferase